MLLHRWDYVRTLIFLCVSAPLRLCVRKGLADGYEVYFYGGAGG